MRRCSYPRPLCGGGGGLRDSCGKGNRSVRRGFSGIIDMEKAYEAGIKDHAARREKVAAAAGLMTQRL